MFEGGSLTCRFAIGTTAGSEQKEKEAVTVENVRRIALEVFPNQASFTGIGAYEGKEEDFVEVHVTEIVRPEGITNCVQFCEKANILLSRVLSELHQDSVLVDVEVLPNDQERRPLKWKTLANANRPAVFPRPTAIARYMIPSAVYRSLKQVYAVASVVRPTLLYIWHHTRYSIMPNLTVFSATFISQGISDALH